MMKFNKVYNFKIILLIASTLFLFATFLYPCPVSKCPLRVPIVQKEVRFLPLANEIRWSSIVSKIKEEKELNAEEMDVLINKSLITIGSEFFSEFDLNLTV